MIKIDKKDFCIVVMLAVICSYFMFCQISIDPRGADRVRDNIKAVGDKQQSVIGRLESFESGLKASINTTTSIARGLEDVENSIRNTQERISASQDRAIGSAELVRQGKSILDGIRKRGQEKN